MEIQVPDRKSDIEIKKVDLIPIYGLIRGGERNESRDLLFGSTYNRVVSMGFVAYHVLALPAIFKGIELIVNNS